jgi:hypothetical protein
VVEHISINIFEENYRSWDRSPQFIGSWERWSDLAIVHNTHPQLFSLHHRQQYYNTKSHRLWRIDQTTCYKIGLLVGCILFMHVHTISALNANTLVGNQLMHFTFPNSVCQIFVLLLFGYVLFIISCRLLFLCILNACLQVNNQPLLFYIVVKRRE